MYPGKKKLPFKKDSNNKGIPNQNGNRYDKLKNLKEVNPDVVTNGQRNNKGGIKGKDIQVEARMEGKDPKNWNKFKKRRDELGQPSQLAGSVHHVPES